MKKWNVLPILFLISGFAQAQGFNIQNSSKKIESLVSQVKKVSAEVKKVEESQYKRKIQIHDACYDLSEKIYEHNSNLGGPAEKCINARTDLESKQEILGSSIEKLKHLNTELDGTKIGIDRLKKLRNQYTNEALDKSILAHKRAINVAKRNLKILAVYNEEGKLISGELKKKIDAKIKIQNMNNCHDNEDYSLGANDRCSEIEAIIKINKEIEIIETTISTLTTSIVELTVTKEGQEALRKIPLIKDRVPALVGLIETLTGTLVGQKKAIATQTKIVTEQKLQVVLAKKEFSKVNSSAGKGTCKSLGIIEEPEVCSTISTFDSTFGW